MRENRKRWLGFGLGTLLGYVLAQQGWALWQLAIKDTARTLRTQLNRAPKGITFLEKAESAAYTRTHTVEDGIERIVYRPRERRFETPILMQHGMWHGAWCWELWQILFAEWGWETHAHSLPGHAGSLTQRPIARCTLDYYLGFLKAEAERLPRPPVLMGHSMGGALTQWYLKYIGDDLPAAVLVAPWVSHSMIRDGLWQLVTYDPVGVLLMLISWDATPMKRQARGSAVRFLVGPQAAVPLEELQPKLGPESVIVMYQHNPPFWRPPERVETPMLWIAGEDDPLLIEETERRSAAHYQADYIVAKGARHNVMMEHNYRETAQGIHDWLVEQDVR
ncbi:MAG TPA: alpha/beta hydrolase [Chloroflexi bacterium]|nr:alpha/beta hydrolase [Chloroflexota bacterium]